MIRAAYRALMRMYHPTRTTIRTPRRALGKSLRLLPCSAIGDGAPPMTRARLSPLARGSRRLDYRGSPFAAHAQPGLASIAIAIAVSLVFALPRSRLEPEPEALRNLAAYRDIAHARPALRPLRRPRSRWPNPRQPFPLPLPTPPQTCRFQLRREMRSPRRQRPGRCLHLPLRRSRGRSSRPPPSAAIARQTANAVPKAAPAPRADDRRAQVERLASGFLKQSLEHADWQRQQLLLSARNRAATSRTLCRSDDCVTEAYLRQIRDTTTIMEGRVPKP